MHRRSCVNDYLLRGGKVYFPLNQCSTLIHLLAKHPILVVALGLVGAIHLLTGHSGVDLSPMVSTEVVEERIRAAEEVYSGFQQQTEEASAIFEALVVQESSVRITSSHIVETGYITQYFQAILDANHARRV